MPEIDEIADKEWEAYLTSMAMKTLRSAYTGRAIEVFQKSLEGLTVDIISVDLGISIQSVYTLKARVKQSLIKEITRLRSDLE